MTIYELIFGQSEGQVCCCFHPDTRASAGISDSGQYNCFACGAKASNEVGFIMNYFGINFKKASNIQFSLSNVERYRYTMLELNQEQRQFLNNNGIKDDIINTYMFRSGADKLMYRHSFNGFTIGTTWFNSPLLSNHNVSASKYKYSGGTIAGMVTPYNDVMKYDNLIICEGEKDMLTAKSMGFHNAVAKVGGAMTDLIAGINFQDKKVILVYDCDQAGRDGMAEDAYNLTDKWGCQVKCIDLGLQDKEDLNDYFIKYHKTKDDLIALIKATPVYILTPKIKSSRFQTFVDSLSAEEIKEVEIILQARKEKENGKNT